MRAEAPDKGEYLKKKKRSKKIYMFLDQEAMVEPLITNLIFKVCRVYYNLNYIV